MMAGPRCLRKAAIGNSNIPTSRARGMRMDPSAAKALGREEERQQRMDELVAEHGPDWLGPYEPGTFGCHELLDRTAMVGDIVEGSILSHPACVQNRDWFALAEQAVSSLRELYHRIGEKHLDIEKG